MPSVINDDFPTRPTIIIENLTINFWIGYRLRLHEWGAVCFVLEMLIEVSLRYHSKLHRQCTGMKFDEIFQNSLQSIFTSSVFLILNHKVNFNLKTRIYLLFQTIKCTSHISWNLVKSKLRFFLILININYYLFWPYMKVFSNVIFRCLITSVQKKKNRKNCWNYSVAPKTFKFYVLQLRIRFSVFAPTA